MKHPDLASWLSYLEQQHPVEIELGLQRITEVAERLKLDFSHCQVVTVAGTNGKGSFIASLNALLMAAGQQVGCYTSPHLLQFNERIVINNEMVSDADLMQAFEQVEQAKQGVSLSYFEFTTLAALLLFAEAKQLNTLLLEVGLGGRLDAVNIVEPDLAVITSIGLDHQDYLGDTRAAIAAEKAGILRAQTALISAEADLLELLPTVEDNRQLHLIGRDFSVQQEAKHWRFESAALQVDELSDNGLSLPSQAAAIVAANQLLANFSAESVAATWSELSLPGRFQTLQSKEGIDIVLDVAHNPQAAKLLKQRLAHMPLPAGAKRIAIFTMLADKNASAVIEILKDDITAWFVGELNHPRARSVESMVELLREQNIAMISTSKNLRQAYSRAVSMSQAGDQIIIFGSFFVVADLLPRVSR